MTQPDTAQPEAPDGFTIIVRQAIFTLTAFFMDGAAGDTTLARAAATELIAAYRIGSSLEIQMAAECIAFAYSAMEALRQVQVNPEISDSKRLRLRNGAASLHRASQRNRRSLDALHKYRNTAPEPQPGLQRVPEELTELSSNPDDTGITPDLLEKIAQHRARVAANRVQSQPPAAPPPFMNREQRRSAKLTARREARRAQG
jgi:hypothetical protein